MGTVPISSSDISEDPESTLCIVRGIPVSKLSYETVKATKGFVLLTEAMVIYREQWMRGDSS